MLEGRGDTDYERYVRVPELLELHRIAGAISDEDLSLAAHLLHRCAMGRGSGKVLMVSPRPAAVSNPWRAHP